MLSAAEALHRLREGNRRFVSGERDHIEPESRERLAELAAGQEPYAIILGCSDSRVPAEIIFDQGVGDLFVIRVAGNVVAPSQIGSVEFAAEQFGTRLVVILGHSSCGAVIATIEELQRPTENRSPNLHSIVDCIRPSVEPLLKAGLDPDELLKQAVRANIRTSTEGLQHGSALLETMIREGSLTVVGAEYSLDTGIVEFYGDLPGRDE